MNLTIIIREYKAETDRSAVEALNEVSTSDKMALHIHFLDGPTSRIRHSPLHLMLVAEMIIGKSKEMVGVVCGIVKSVSCGKRSTAKRTPLYIKVGYLLGLRVSPSRRRMGVGLKLVRRIEEWFREKRAEYSYIATEIDNEPSINLFTVRCGYSRFRTPAVLVHPVFSHRLPVPRAVTVLRLSAAEAEAAYHRHLAVTEFFPQDIGSILSNPLTIATFLAVPKEWARSGRGALDFLTGPAPASWAMLSVWDCKGVFELEVKGASMALRAVAAVSRAVDKAAPWLRVPSVPDVFRPFGAWFVYGLGGEGADVSSMTTAAWREAHNFAMGNASVVASEVAAMEPVSRGIGWWRRLSIDEDLWCVKRLCDEYSDGSVGDWTKSTPGTAIFVDPREL